MRDKTLIIEEIVKIIENNPNILENLDISKLEIIDSYYQQKIDECKKKIEKRNN